LRRAVAAQLHDPFQTCPEQSRLVSAQAPPFAFRSLYPVASCRLPLGGIGRQQPVESITRREIEGSVMTQNIAHGNSLQAVRGVEDRKWRRDFHARDPGIEAKPKHAFAVLKQVEDDIILQLVRFVDPVAKVSLGVEHHQARGLSRQRERTIAQTQTAPDLSFF
jgi:hypothetical protein